MGDRKGGRRTAERRTVIGQDTEDAIQLRRYLRRADEKIRSIVCTTRRTWKFFSFQPFLPKKRTTTSESRSLTQPSTQVVISSRAAKRFFQLESPRSVANFAGISSAASASASSGVCLYLKVSSAPGPGAAPPFAGFDVAAAAAGGSFFGAGAETAGALLGALLPSPATGGFLA